MRNAIVLLVVVAMLVLAMPTGSADAAIITGVDRSNGYDGDGYDTNTDPAIFVGPSPNGLKVGRIAYGDRDYDWDTVASALVGADYVQTFNNDKKDTVGGNVRYAVTVSKATTLYVLLDSRTSLTHDDLDWLTDNTPGCVFSDSGLNCTIKTPGPGGVGEITVTFDAWSANVSAGTYTLKGIDQNSDRCFYAIAAIPEPATLALLGLGGIGALLRRRRK